jgi:hypothetical protein
MTPLVFMLLTACIGDLDPPSIVVTPRILAIVAEPPESAPGTDISVDAMISIPDDVERPLSLAWRACLSPQEVLQASGFRNIEIPGAPDCDPQTLAEGEPYVVRGERTQALVDLVRTLGSLGGFDTSLIEGVLATTGFAFFIDVDVIDANGDIVVSGYKRVAMTTRVAPTTNPPQPEFRVGDLVVETTGRFTCTAEGGQVPVIEPNVEIELAPLLPEGLDEEPWLESFPIFDFTGGLQTAEENAYYTWYATAGSLSEHTTRPPDREVTWTTPDEAGPHTLWLVIRDGHLGQSACRLDVVIGP